MVGWAIVALLCWFSADTANAARLYNRKLRQAWQVAAPWTTSDFASGTGATGDSPASARAVVAAAAPAPVGGNTSACPTITLHLYSVEIYNSVVNDPTAALAVQCYTRDGTQFKAVEMSTQSATVRGPQGARYTPGTNVARITCGQAVTCRVGDASAASGATWDVLADGGCWFDYRHFTQLSYQEPLSAWTCSKPPVRYTLECVECTQPGFNWQAALAQAGPPLTNSSAVSSAAVFNSAWIIISVSVVSVAAVLVALALLVRSRRRTAAANEHVSEVVRRARNEQELGRRPGSRRKRPDMFVVGSPQDGPLPAEYRGPIVVMQPAMYYGEGGNRSGSGGQQEGPSGGGAEGASSAAVGSGQSSFGGASRVACWPQLAIAMPEAGVVEAGGEQASPGPGAAGVEETAELAAAGSAHPGAGAEAGAANGAVPPPRRLQPSRPDTALLAVAGRPRESFHNERVG